VASKNKARGTRWESAIRDWFNAKRLKSYRPAQNGGADLGDVHVDGLVVVQAKDAHASRYVEWVADAKQQASNAGFPFGVVVHKSRNRSIEDARVVMDLGTFGELVRRLRLAEDFIATTPHVRAAYESVIEDWSGDPLDVP